MKEKLHYDDKGSTFKEAFAEARAEGKKTFEWNGEKYNTKLKEKEKASMDEGIPKKTRADEKVGEGYEKVGKSEAKEETRKPTNRGGAAALAGAGVGLGACIQAGRRYCSARQDSRENLLMPAKSAKQERFMQAVANNPKFAKKVGVPVTVGQEFTKAKGGEMKESKAMMKKEIGFMKKKGAPKSMIKHEMAEAGMKPKKMASGGLAAGHKSADGVASKGKTKAKQVKMAYGGKC